MPDAAVPDAAECNRHYNTIAKAIAFIRAHAGAQPTLDEIAADAGLSSTSRLHDLMVSCEAMTPGEIKSGGLGMEIGCGFLIPCHRVIRESGEAGHYRWGSERKLAMLGWEAARGG